MGTPWPRMYTMLGNNSKNPYYDRKSINDSYKIAVICIICFFILMAGLVLFTIFNINV